MGEKERKQESAFIQSCGNDRVESATGDKVTEPGGDARRWNVVTRSPLIPLRGETAARQQHTGSPWWVTSSPAAAWCCSRAWRDEGRWWLRRNVLCTRCHSTLSVCNFKKRQLCYEYKYSRLSIFWCRKDKKRILFQTACAIACHNSQTDTHTHRKTAAVWCLNLKLGLNWINKTEKAHTKVTLSQN